MSATVRQLRWRTRVRDGRAVLAVEVDEVATAAMLVDAGLLRADKADDRQAVARALEAQIRALIELHRLVSSDQTT